MVKLIVDGREIEAGGGKSLLEVCLDNGIYIPNLCFLKEMTNPPASCRMCFVQIEGEPRPVTSCKVAPREGMVVRTDTEGVRRLQRSALQLLLSVHHVDCRNCRANKKCALQHTAKLLHVSLKPKRLPLLIDPGTQKQDFHHFLYDPLKCVLCGRCVYVCRNAAGGRSFLTFAKRGFDTVISSFAEDDPAPDVPCNGCRACLDVCPVGALIPKDSLE